MMLTLKQQAALHVAKIVGVAVLVSVIGLTSIAYIGVEGTFLLFVGALTVLIFKDIYVSKLEDLERLERLNEKMAE